MMAMLMTFKLTSLALWVWVSIPRGAGADRIGLDDALQNCGDPKRMTDADASVHAAVSVC